MQHYISKVQVTIYHETIQGVCFCLVFETTSPTLMYDTVDGLIFVGYQFSCDRGGSYPGNLVPTKKGFSVCIMKENAMTTNFEPHKGVIFAHTTKIGTQENKAIHSVYDT